MLKIICVGQNHEGKEFTLLTERKYLVGREEADFLLLDDASISRVHAELVAEHPSGNLTEPLLAPVLTVMDLNSREGTYATEHNIKEGVRISLSERITLACGDRIRFGKLWNEYMITYTPFVITTSGYKASPELKETVGKLGGHVVEEWSNSVTHVVTTSSTLTNKVVCALLSAKPIVKPLFVFHLLAAIEAGEAYPDPKNYTPPFEENVRGVSEASFHPNRGRTALFAGKTFLFYSDRHMRRLADAVKAGGGTVRNLSSIVNENLASDEFIIVGDLLDMVKKERDSKIQGLLEIYKRTGKRVISDGDIGLAAVLNSIDKYCNPSFENESQKDDDEVQVIGDVPSPCNGPLLRQAIEAAASKDDAHEPEIITLDDDDEDDDGCVDVNDEDADDDECVDLDDEEDECDDADDDDVQFIMTSPAGTSSSAVSSEARGERRKLEEDETETEKKVKLNEDETDESAS